VNITIAVSGAMDAQWRPTLEGRSGRRY